MASASWFGRRRQVDADVRDEIASHLAMATADRVADGADPRAARQAAIKDFGNVTLTTEAARGVWSNWWRDAVGHWSNDVRYAVRVLIKSPGFSLIVIAVLALGIGLNAAVFSLFKGLALAPLGGVRDSGRLAVVLGERHGGRQGGISYPDFKYFREHDRSFADISGSSMSMLSLGLGRQSERILGEFVTGNYFELFGVRALMGRTLLAADDVAPGRHPVVVLSEGLWRRAFGGDPDIIGKTVHLNAYPLTVVGVASPDFHGSIVSFDIEAFVPVMMTPQLGLSWDQSADGVLANPRSEIMMVYARPRPGVSLALATSQTAQLSAQLETDAPLRPTAGEATGTDFAQRLLVVPIWQSPFGAQTYMLPAVLVLGAMGALLLLIVCANIAGLVLVRGISRRAELAVRVAVGASRLRILRLLLIENILLAVPGAVIGLLLVSCSLPLLWSGMEASTPVRIFFDLKVDSFVVGFTVLAATASAIGFGFMPALRASRVDLASVMKDGLSPRSAGRSRLRAALVVAQVAVSLLLLVGAGLVTRTLDAARRADAGFDATNVSSVSVDLKPNGYDDVRGRAFYQQLLDRVRAETQTESATLASVFPMTMVDPPGQKVVVEGYTPRPDDDLNMAYNVVAPDYFKTLRVGLVAGREFEAFDDPTGQPVIIVNATLAQRFFGGASQALGKRVRLVSGQMRTIVGVARDVKYARINEAPRPYIYLPLFQVYTTAMMLHTRGSAGTAVLIDQARGHIQSLDPNLPVLEAKTLTEQTTASLTIFRFTAAILVVFGAAAMGLAAMGIYGLVSYSVKQSTHEIGIRMALGARHIAVVGRYLGGGLRLGFIGAVLGAGGAFAATRLLRAILFGVSATDPVSFAGAAAIVIGSTLVATLVPAWRAGRVNPMSALRQH